MADERTYPNHSWEIIIRPLILGFLIFGLTGCANLSPTGQRALSGGAIGAAGGAVLGAVAGGNPAVGAAVGGAAGAAAGALLPQMNQ